MKKIALVLLLFLLVACTNATPDTAISNPTATPITSVDATATVATVTASIESTPITVPVESKTIELQAAEIAHAAKWNPNDETTWNSIPAGVTADVQTYLQEMRNTNADPNEHLDLLQKYDDFMTELRRVHLAKTGMDTAVLETLTPEEIANLEMDWAARNGTEYMPTHIEMQRWKKQTNAAILDKSIHYATLVDEKNVPRYPETGWAGMWLNKSYREDSSLHTVEYPISMFGDAEPWIGNWDGDIVEARNSGVLRLPYGRTGLLLGFPRPDGFIGMPVIVVPEDEQALTPTVFVFDGTGLIPFEPNIALHTRLRPGKPEVFIPLTRNDLINSINRLLYIQTPSEAYESTGFYMFFDEKTGLPVIGSSIAADNLGFQTSIWILDE